MIDLDLDDACAPEDVLFANADWRVLADGLEHRGTGYVIARESIAMRRQGDLWEWPLHLSEKSWCGLRPFREAFLAALSVYGIDRDPWLSQSFAIGFGLNAGQGVSPTSEDFVSLGDVVRPRPVAKASARKRSPTPDTRLTARRSNMPATPMPQRSGDIRPQRVAL